MQKAQINLFLAKLLSQYIVYAPVKVDDHVVVKKITDPKEVDWSGQIPTNTYKSIFLPDREVLATLKKEQFVDESKEFPPTVIFGMNILDLEAFGLFEQVFAKDEYYLLRRRNLHIVGFSQGIEDDYKRYQIFHHDFEENILEHRAFDVFIEAQKNGNLIVFSGSENGQRLLEKNDITDYENIEFVGFVPEFGRSKKLDDLRSRVYNGAQKAIWDEISAKCIACGRCTVTCPTCFCFDTVDEFEHDTINRVRQWSSCFFNDFSGLAGGHEYLDTVKKKIAFWYFHKFVRIPDQFSYAGCVSCMRCFKVCPAGINIAQVLTSLNKQDEKSTLAHPGENHTED